MSLNNNYNYKTIENLFNASELELIHWKIMQSRETVLKALMQYGSINQKVT